VQSVGGRDGAHELGDQWVAGHVDRLDGVGVGDRGARLDRGVDRRMGDDPTGIGLEGVCAPTPNPTTTGGTARRRRCIGEDRKDPFVAKWVVDAAVSPNASRAAKTPLAAAFPAWNGLVMDPKASRCPNVMVDAAANAASRPGPSSPSNRPAATAATEHSARPVMCQPRS